MSFNPVQNNSRSVDVSPADWETAFSISPRPTRDFVQSGFDFQPPQQTASIVGKIWNSPNTLIGLAWGLLGVPFGAKVDVGNNSIQFKNHPFTFSAITLGNTISYAKDLGPEVLHHGVSVGDHERQHTYQGEMLGPMYLFSNLLGGLAGLLRDGSWHGPSNWNERGPQNVSPKPW